MCMYIGDWALGGNGDWEIGDGIRGVPLENSKFVVGRWDKLVTGASVLGRLIYLHTVGTLYLSQHVYHHDHIKVLYLYKYRTLQCSTRLAVLGKCHGLLLVLLAT